MPGCYIIISPPEQQTSGGKYEVCKIHDQEMWHTNNDVNFALLQIKSTLIDTVEPSPATLLFNRPIRVLLPQIGREPININ